MTTVVLEYGAGNVRSVVNAVRRVARERVEVVGTGDVLRATAFERVILPGVGAIGHALAQLRDRGLESTLRERVLGSQIPLLGICVGMQMLFETADEFGHHACLGLLPGHVERLAAESVEAAPEAPVLRLPHVGWNDVAAVDHPLFTRVREADFYFAHSHAVRCADEVVLATTRYGRDFASAVGRGAVTGVQFHPEKSSAAGETVLRNFLCWHPC